MRDEYEELLRQYRRDPGPRVKGTVMSHFSNEFENQAAPMRRVSFWKRPVPLYLAALVLIFSVGLSFVAGRTMSSASGEARYGNEQKGLSDNAKEPLLEDLTWESAPADML